jgi:hypothetical protein
MAAASRNDRSNASSTTGTTMLRSPRRPRRWPARSRPALDQLRGDADAHHDRDAELVERTGKDPQGPPWVGEGVRGADAAEQHGQPHAVRGCVEGRFQRHRTAELHVRGPVRQRKLRQVEQHVRVAVDRTAEHRPEDDPDDDHAEAERDVVLQAAGPRRVGAPHRHDIADHREGDEQDQRVACGAHRRTEPDRPQPPGRRVQRPLHAPMVRDHSRENRD